MATRLARRRSAPRDAEERYEQYEDDYEYYEDEENQRPAGRAVRREAPRRSRDEDERPRRRSRDEDERPRRRSRDDDEDEAPRRSYRGGWDAFRDERAKSSGFSGMLKVTKKEVVVKFLQDGPFAVYRQHWGGGKSHTCIEQNCPMCAAGYETRYIALFNVVELESGENKYWAAGPQAAKAVQALAEGQRYSPIDREDLYFSLQRKELDNGFKEYSITPVKERDLEDDYPGLEPLDEKELDDALASMFDDSVIPSSTARQLRAVVAGKDDDDD